MILRRHFILYPLSFILLFGGLAFAQLPYDAGDWTSWRNFGFARAADAGSRDVFIATSGGILHYELFRREWTDPLTVGYSVSEAIVLDDPLLLLYDEQTNFLWVATETQLLRYDVNGERWERTHRNLWGIGERVVNIGVGGSNLYVETIPNALYDRLFLPGLPLPLGGWEGYVTRYAGSRTFGGLMHDINPQADEGEIRWRGLRSRQPLAHEDLFGNLGLPPLNIPALLMPAGWVLQSDGTLLDPYLRPYPITDWIVDRFANLWATFNGAGILQADLRTGRAQILNPGPAGNDIRALLLEREAVWLGGFNSGERQGINRAGRDLKDWQFYESRDNSRIHSTEVFDIIRWNNSLWFATTDGLLEFKEQEGRWKVFTVGEGLQSDQIRALAAMDTQLWIGSTSGLAVMTPAENKLSRIPVAALGLVEILDLAAVGTTLYISTPLGLYAGAPDSRDFRNVPLDPGLLNAPVEEMTVAGTELWLATAEGVEVYNTNTGEAQAWIAADWMNNSQPTCVTVTEPYVWVGTRQNGFYRFYRSRGQWIGYTTADGLIDNHVQVLRPDGDDLLIGTGGGLTRFYWNRSSRPK